MQLGGKQLSWIAKYSYVALISSNSLREVIKNLISCINLVLKPGTMHEPPVSTMFWQACVLLSIDSYRDAHTNIITFFIDIKIEYAIFGSSSFGSPKHYSIVAYLVKKDNCKLLKSLYNLAILNLFFFILSSDS